MVYLTRALVLRIAAQLSGGSATSCCSVVKTGIWLTGVVALLYGPHPILGLI